MPIIKTNEELLASKIKARNYSSALASIYFLKNRVFSDYVPSSPNTAIWTFGEIGTGAGTSKVFSTASATAARGGIITLTGTATYLRTSGATSIICPAIKVAAYIDQSREGFEKIDPIYASAGEIDASGVFSFPIAADITQKLSIGTHTVYIDAYSPDNSVVRLTVTGTTDNKKLFSIT